MKIGIDASRANRTHKSGTEWYSYYIIRALAELDQENEYILYSDVPLTNGLADLTADNEAEQKIIVRDNWQIIKSPHNNFRAKILNWPWKFFWTQGRLSLEMFFKAPDVLFVPAHALPIIHPTKSVVTIHDIGFRRAGRLYERSDIGAEKSGRQRFIDLFVRLLTLNRYGANTFDYLDWSTGFSLAQAKAIITISEFTKSELKELYKTKGDNLHVIYNGYPSHLYRQLDNDPIGEEVLARYGLKQPYIFYVGRLEKKKNIAALVEAFYLFKNRRPDLSHKLYLVGDASFGFDDIKYSIYGFGLQKDILTTGWVAEHDLPYIFSRAAAFVFPSNYEGFGIPLLQAMATGTPIVASRIASIPEIAQSAALLFDPTDPGDMANALAAILTDEDLRQRLIKDGLERVKEFNWEKCARETLGLLKSL